ncbi:response regulator [Ideonella sp.]|uniref:response regulator n=1 Tax=Ideonella sp. TaxID=1929293 RepID=UPI003BB6B250
MPSEATLTALPCSALRYEPRHGVIDGQIKGGQAHGSSGPIALPTSSSESEALVRAACLDWAGRTWPASAPRSLALDVWPATLEVSAFGTQLLALIQAAGIEARLVTLICRESQLRLSLQAATQTLGQLKAAGMRIELLLDEPGQGYSSFLCLRCLPIDRINVPASLLDPRAPSQEQLSVLRTLVGMARGMHLEVLASGVDTAAQRAQVEKLGVDEWQGQAVSPCLTGDAFLQQCASPPNPAEAAPAAPASERTLLLVDDEENILAALRRLVRREGYRILTATSAAAGLELLKSAKVDVIISDQRMPGMTGVDFLRRAKALYPDTMRMTLSGYADLQSIIDAVNEGSIYKFLTKPWEDDRLRAHVAEAFRQKEMADENRRLNDEVANANAELASLNERMARMLVQQREQSSLMAASADGVHALLEDLPVALVGVDPDGLLAYANHCARTLFGAERLSPGMPASPLIVDLGQGLADGPPDAGARLFEVDQQRCLVWRRSLRHSNGMARGFMLSLLPWPDEGARS